MTRFFLLPLLLLIGTAAVAKEAAHPDSSEWKPLVAEDFSNVTNADKGWKFAEGVLEASEDVCLFTKDVYESCVIDLEFKNAKDTNSGVVIYCTDTKNWIPNSVEVQIADDHGKWGKAGRSWQCGAIFGHLAAYKGVVKKPGEWNRMTITCKGQHIGVVLNGEKVINMDMSKWTSAKMNPDGSEIPPWLSTPFAKLPTKGRIGLQGKHGDSPIYFRNVKVKTL